MLVLTRKQQEKIRIGENVTVTILRIKGNTVRVGIEAPRDVRVVRSELGPLSESDDQQPSPAAADAQPTVEVMQAPTAVQVSADAGESTRRDLILAIRTRLAGAMC